MWQLLGSSTADMPILQQLLLEHLPMQATLVLIAASELTLDQQARLADKVLDLSDTAWISTACTSLEHWEVGSAVVGPALHVSL